VLSYDWFSAVYLQSDDCREKGNQCMKEEKYIEAMLHYTHGIKCDPRSAYLYSNRSLAFTRMQQYYYALKDAKTAIQLRPNWTKVCRRLWLYVWLHLARLISADNYLTHFPSLLLAYVSCDLPLTMTLS